MITPEELQQLNDLKQKFKGRVLDYNVGSLFAYIMSQRFPLHIESDFEIYGNEPQYQRIISDINNTYAQMGNVILDMVSVPFREFMAWRARVASGLPTIPLLSNIPLEERIYGVGESRYYFVRLATLTNEHIDEYNYIDLLLKKEGFRL